MEEKRSVEIINNVQIEPKQYNNVIAKEIIDILKQKHYTISTAESCTAGRFVAALTSMSGSSEVVKGGICAYCNEMKCQLLHVPQEQIDQYTEVSEIVAQSMASGIKKVMGTHCSLSSTGYADGIGLIYVCASVNEKYIVKKLQFHSTRLYNTVDAVKKD